MQFDFNTFDSPFKTYDRMWSVSRLNTLTRCELKYYFKYIKKLPEDQKYWLTRGIVFHEAAAKIALENITDPKVINDFINNKWEQLESEGFVTATDSNLLTPEMVLKSVRISAKNYLAMIKAHKKFYPLEYTLNGITKKTIEMPFRIPFVDLETGEPYAKVDLIGFIDIIEYNSTLGVCINDHKLHGPMYNDFKLFTDFQLPVYYYVVDYLRRNKVIDIGINEKINIGFNSHQIKRNGANMDVFSKHINVKYTKKWLQKSLNLVADFINRMEINAKSGLFLPSYVENDCKYNCSFNQVCLDWRKDKDLDKYFTNSNMKVRDDENEVI